MYNCILLGLHKFYSSGLKYDGISLTVCIYYVVLRKRTESL